MTNDHVIASVSSDDDVSDSYSRWSLETNAFNSSVQAKETSPFSINVYYNYLLKYFRHVLSRETKLMKTQNFIDNIFSYVFKQVSCSIHVRSIRDSFSRQISHFVQVTRKRVGQPNIIKLLNKRKFVHLDLNTAAVIHFFPLSNDFVEYGNPENAERVFLPMCSF